MALFCAIEIMISSTLSVVSVVSVMSVMNVMIVMSVLNPFEAVSMMIKSCFPPAGISPFVASRTDGQFIVPTLFSACCRAHV